MSPSQATHMKPAPPVTRMFLTPSRSAFLTLPMSSGACAGAGANMKGEFGRTGDAVAIVRRLMGAEWGRERDERSARS